MQNVHGKFQSHLRGVRKVRRHGMQKSMQCLQLGCVPQKLGRSIAILTYIRSSWRKHQPQTCPLYYSIPIFDDFSRVLNELRWHEQWRNKMLSNMEETIHRPPSHTITSAATNLVHVESLNISIERVCTCWRKGVLGIAGFPDTRWPSFPWVMG